ncbi:MAG: helix-turn-helix domain-containing protein [Oligoflexia bacterium]|nr:helix-turn-helix domain-containing protein [Oligoflexia bacterium]
MKEICSKYTKSENNKLVYTVLEAAEILGICKTSLYNLVQENRVPYLRFGRRIVIPKAALQKLLDLHIKGANK